MTDRDAQHMIWAHRLALLDIVQHSPGERQIDPYEVEALGHEIRTAGGDWNEILRELLAIIRGLVWDANTEGRVCHIEAAVQHVQNMLDDELARIELNP
jgi:hypothetical protein